MSTPAGNMGIESPFPHRLLQALVSELAWEDLAVLAVESWIRLAGASVALLLGPVSTTELQAISCRAVFGSSPQTGCTQVKRPFGSLLDRETVLAALAETGLFGGTNIDVSLWPDLAAVLVVQFSDETAQTPSAGKGIRAALTPICRQLLSRAFDRAVLIPDSNQLEAMAEYAAGAGHEINNPLGSILGQTQLLLKTDPSTDRRQIYETIGAQAWRIRDMIGNSMLFARPPQPQKTRLNLVETVQEALQTLSKVAGTARIEFRFQSTSDNICLFADPTQVCILLSQFVRNSIEALRGADRPGMISVILRDELPKAVEISVVDNGPGIISADVRRHLFNPFYSGRSAGRGLGFGLCLAWQIVRMHGGLIHYETPINGGTAFHVALPKSSS